MSLVFHVANAVVFFFVTVELLSRSRPDLPPGDRRAGAGVAAGSSRYIRCALRLWLGPRVKLTFPVLCSGCWRFWHTSVPIAGMIRGHGA